MRWSKLKTKVESLFANPVQNRVKLHSTRYRGAHDQEGRGFITFDKKEIWSMCTISFFSVEHERIYNVVKRECLSALVPIKSDT